jgi:2,3-dihydroxybenzoate decarboxylase
MDGKIAFEEHIGIHETIEETRAFAGESANFSEFTKELLDVGDHRLEQMDKTGIEYAILSINAPGVQSILGTAEAIEVAKKGNDRMAQAVSDHPDRYGAFAALPMQDPDAACEELTRCMKMGFKGAMVNGFTQKDSPDNCLYYDMPEFHDFWATVSKLDAPFYLHPRMQAKTRAQNYEGHPWLMSSPWGFAVETSIHTLRMCGSGIFGEFPNLRFFIGHLGENIPFGLWRIDARMAFSARGYRGDKPLGYYFKKNVYVTTSGNFCDASLRCTLDMLDHDHVFFSADYPFERMEDAADWWDASTVVSEEEKVKLARTNAIKQFKLDLK